MTRARSKAALERVQSLGGAGERTVIEVRTVLTRERTDAKGRRHHVQEDGAHHPQCPTCLGNAAAREDGAALTAGTWTSETGSTKSDPGKSILSRAGWESPVASRTGGTTRRNTEVQNSARDPVDGEYDSAAVAMRAFRLSPEGQQLIADLRREERRRAALRELLARASRAAAALERLSEGAFKGEIPQADFERTQREINGLVALNARNYEHPEAARLIRDAFVAADAEAEPAESAGTTPEDE
jgi:hypothetical protein